MVLRPLAVLAAALVVATVFLTAASRPRHVADAAVLAASPLLVLVPLVSADTLGVAPTAAGLWAWGRRQPLLAGALLGVAVAARTYPLLILLALVLLGLRTGRWAAVRRTLLGAAGGAGLVLLPFLVSNPGRSPARMPRGGAPTPVWARCGWCPAARPLAAQRRRDAPRRPRRRRLRAGTALALGATRPADGG